MLKRVPNDLSPYTYPREPGFATAALLDRNLMQIKQPTLYLHNSFLLRTLVYDAFPGSDTTVESELRFTTGQAAQEAWAKQTEDLELSGMDILVEQEQSLACPVAAGYEFAQITVLSAIWNPWTKEFKMELISPEGDATFEKGMTVGNIDVAGRFLDHLQETFGYAPKVQL